MPKKPTTKKPTTKKPTTKKPTTKKPTTKKPVKQSLATQKRIEDLKAQLKVAVKDFYSMPRRESFSGIAVANKIDKIQQELRELGAEWKPHYVEINIGIY